MYMYIEILGLARRILMCFMVNGVAVSIVVICVQVAQVTEEDKRLVEEGVEDDEPPVGVDFITFMMHAGKMDLETIATNALDLMGAGVDTVIKAQLQLMYTTPGWHNNNTIHFQDSTTVLASIVD
jgi:hypothetical protein